MNTFERRPFDEAVTVAIAIDRHAPAVADAAAELNDLAHARALPGPVIVQGRSLTQEALEELADARNYLVWQHHIRTRQDAGDDELATIEQAIAAVASAWQCVSAVHTPIEVGA